MRAPLGLLREGAPARLPLQPCALVSGNGEAPIVVHWFPVAMMPRVRKGGLLTLTNSRGKSRMGVVLARVQNRIIGKLRATVMMDTSHWGDMLHKRLGLEPRWQRGLVFANLMKSSRETSSFLLAFAP